MKEGYRSLLFSKSAILSIALFGSVFPFCYLMIFSVLVEGWGLRGYEITAAEAISRNNNVNLAALTGDITLLDGDIVTGTLQGNKKISVASGATITLKDVAISLDGNGAYAGISPLGNAKIILEGVNYVKGGGEGYPAILAPVGYTLTIDGSGSLTATATNYSAAIGGGDWNAGNIVINGGTINDTAAYGSAGIGCSSVYKCGTITINGGTIIATGGDYAAGIGSGAYTSSCRDITINGGTVEATGGDAAPGIGSGYNSSSCGKITISANVTSVTATKGSDAPNSIGAGDKSTCSDVTIAPGANVIEN